MKNKQILLLTRILDDSESSITEKDDAATLLGQFNNDDAIKALVSSGMKKDEDETLLNSCGESIGEIWVKRNLFDITTFRKLSGTARFGVIYVLRHHRPEWIQTYNLEKDSFKD